MKISILRLFLAALGLAVGILATPSSPQAQALGWEGETGVFVTPLAYTATSDTQKVHPVMAYHYLNGRSVIGDFDQASITVGFYNRTQP